METVGHQGQDFEAPKGMEVVQYEPKFDRERARQLEVKIGTDSYVDEAREFEGYINFQLLTTIGERFNRGESKFLYRAREEKLLGEHVDEPVEDIFERGRQYREIYGNKIDHPREQAEVDGFRKVQDLMVDPETPEGTVMISISPPGGDGSIYKHNFYDIFQKQPDGTVVASRFSSALTPEETILNLGIRWPMAEYPKEWDDVGLLSNPISLGKVPSIEDVHRLIQKDHEVMTEEEFQVIQEAIAPLITSYIATLKTDLSNESKQHILLNAILNKADIVADSLKQQVIVGYEDQYDEMDWLALGMRSVRVVDTGCGLSGGFGGEGSMADPAGVMDFGFMPFRQNETDQYGSLYFDCPSIMCRKVNKRPLGQLIEKCQHCFTDVRCGDEEESSKKKKSSN